MLLNRKRLVEIRKASLQTVSMIDAVLKANDAPKSAPEQASPAQSALNRKLRVALGIDPHNQ